MINTLGVALSLCGGSEKLVNEPCGSLSDPIVSLPIDDTNVSSQNTSNSFVIGRSVYSDFHLSVGGTIGSIQIPFESLNGYPVNTSLGAIVQIYQGDQTSFTEGSPIVDIFSFASLLLTGTYSQYYISIGKISKKKKKNKYTFLIFSVPSSS